MICLLQGDRQHKCVNPLTAFWRRLTLAACYQLAQSVVKIVLL